jgi:hypothetical protein
MKGLDEIKSLVKLSHILDWSIVKKSIIVDLISMITTNRNAIRIPKQNEVVTLAIIKEWSEFLKYSFAMDESYCVISKKNDAGIILEIDRSIAPHTFQFGLQLGYPDCCSMWMSDIGENKIDYIGDITAQSRNYDGKWSLINHSNYHTGKAWVSHITCNDRCLKSLNLALESFTCLKKNFYDAELHKFNHPEKKWFLEQLTRLNLK